ncbi:MAG: DMT family transporter [Anaerolineales bacterium]|jgi:drug/metabolite transporter (DMT)-like permease
MTYLKLILTTLFWGGTFIAGRIAAVQIGPFSGALGRFLFASLVLLAVLLLRRERLPRLDRRRLLLLCAMAISGVIGYNAAFFLGLRQIDASRASLIIALNPIFIALGTALFFGERLPRMGLAGIAVSLIGAALVITRGDLSQIRAGFGSGELFILGAVLCWLAYTLLGKVALRSLEPLAATTYTSLIGCLGIFPLSLLETHTWSAPSPSLLAALAYLGLFGTALGFTWYYDALGELGPVRTGIFLNLVPLFGVLLGVLLLGEQLSPAALFGGLLIVAGVTLTNRSKAHRPAAG